MSKSFVVTRGEYSDYSIMGVYTTREIADEAARLFAGHVEEYETDVLPEHPPGKLFFWVFMSKSGDSKKVSNQGVDCAWNGQEASPSSNDWMFFQLWADDEEQAVKVANEQRAIAIAENRWGEKFKF